MGTTLARSLMLTATALLLLGTTACAGSPKPAAETAAPGDTSPPGNPAAPSSLSLVEAQGTIPWPKDKTLPIPEGMSFESIENDYACDGTLLGFLISSPDATERSAESYLVSIQDLFMIPEEVRSGHGAGSLKERDSDALDAESHLQDKPNAADATKLVSWERLDGGGYRFNLQETTVPGTFTRADYRSPSSWVPFPRPEVPWESCDTRERSSYREGAGFTPASTTWTLTGSPVMQPEVQKWMEELFADGWSVKENPAMAGAGMPEAILTSEDHTVQYVMSDGELTLFVSDRNLDKVLGF